jgi:hypothetical protein
MTVGADQFALGQFGKDPLTGHHDTGSYRQSWFQTRRAHTLHPGGDARNRTGSATLAGRARYLSYSSPGAGRVAPPGNAHALELTTCKPVQGATQGRKVSNPLPPVLETGALPGELLPYALMRTARQGLPCGRLPCGGLAPTRKPPGSSPASRTTGWRRASPESASLRTCVPYHQWYGGRKAGGNAIFTPPHG